MAIWSKNYIYDDESEIQQISKYSYLRLVEYLQEKYGKPEGNYFIDESCKQKNNSISKTKRGLVIHHVAENKFLSLSTPYQAYNKSFEYQTPDYLVYCNLLEHLLLHIKISIEYKGVKERGVQVGIGGINTFLVPLLNDIYSGFISQDLEAEITLRVIENFKDYLFLIDLMNKNKILSSRVYSSLNEFYGTWSHEYNDEVYQKIKLITSLPLNYQILKENQIKLRNNSRLKATQTTPPKEEKSILKSPWLYLVIISFIAVFVLFVFLNI